jgi:hypothetical protein
VSSRLQFEIDATQSDLLNRLQQACGFRTKKELFENAIALLNWAVLETLNRNTVGSVSEKGVEHELHAPFLHMLKASTGQMPELPMLSHSVNGKPASQKPVDDDD